MSSVNFYRDTTAKFTRGEKCIFIHLVITFVSILIMIIIYFVHLCIVEHFGNEIFRVARKSFANQSVINTSIYHILGVVYLNASNSKIVCNALLIRTNWSIAPAHIVATRSDLDMLHYLASWRIKYRFSELPDIETGVKRSLVHTRFSRNDCQNNIGLLEHNKLITLPDDLVLNRNIFDIDKLDHQKDLVLVTWNTLGENEKDFFKITIPLSSMNLDDCSNYLSPIINQMRNYEFCASIQQPSETYIYHGAVLTTNSKIIGFFSWGDRRGKGVPLVILNLAAFKERVEDMII